MSAMEKIIKQKIDEIDNELILDTIRQASAELTASKVTDLHCEMCFAEIENNYHCSEFSTVV